MSSARQSLPSWPHAVAVAVALIALGYATGRVRAPATPAEPSIVDPAQRARTPAPPEPQVNVPIFELAAGAQSVEWPDSSPLATFVLGLASTPVLAEYALRVRTEAGTNVLIADGLKPTRASALSVAVPRRMMPPGRYRFELRAPGAGPETAPRGDYAVEVR